MNLLCVLLGMLFCIAGILFACGKGHIHLSAWKAMPEEEKKKIKIMPLCRNIGTVIVLSGIVFLIKGMRTGFSDRWFVCAMVTWFIIAGFDVWYIGKSNRYHNQ